MRAKPAFGVIGMLVGALYCGGLLVYFYSVGGSVEGITEIGLGPTMLGLGIVGLLFCIPLLVALVRILARRRPPGPDGHSGGSDDGDSGFDADAVVTRYLAQPSAQAAARSPTPSQPSTRSGASKGFGRRSR